MCMYCTCTTTYLEMGQRKGRCLYYEEIWEYLTKVGRSSSACVCTSSSVVYILISSPVKLCFKILTIIYARILTSMPATCMGLYIGSCLITIEGNSISLSIQAAL